jgi:Bacterial protein of unknown function (DUF899)
VRSPRARTEGKAEGDAVHQAQDRLNEKRHALPRVRLDKSYTFDGPAGLVTLSELFGGRSQLIIRPFMFGPYWSEGCVGCSFECDQVERVLQHLLHHDVVYAAVSRALIDRIERYKQRMGCSAALPHCWFAEPLRPNVCQPEHRHDRVEPSDRGAGGSASADDPGLTAAAALRSPQFIMLALTYFICCATHSGPIFHTVSYTISCGLPAMVAVSIYSVEGFAGLGGRLLFGVLGDRFGAQPVLVAGLLVRCGGVFFVRETYAGVMPLYAVIARENFPMHVMGTVFGAGTMASGLGMALGPLAGGWIFDTYASYGWLYIGSFGMGLGPSRSC